MGGAIVMFVFGLGSLGAWLLGRQNKPRQTRGTRVSSALSRVHFHQWALKHFHCNLLPYKNEANYTDREEQDHYNPLKPRPPSPMNTTAPAPNSAPVGFGA